MKLRGIEFGHAFNASGARNFFGTDAWWFHRLTSSFGLSYRGSTLVTKTTTLNKRNDIGKKEGFMPLEEDSTTPVELMPGCIKVYPFKNVVLNKVGLSGQGIDWLLEQGIWQSNVEPFVISIMAVEKASDQRLMEIRAIASRIAKVRDEFCAPFALQINFSCPNVGHQQLEMVGQVGDTLDILTQLLPGVPLILKFNAQLLVPAALDIEKREACDAIVMGNTIPFGQLKDRIDWKGLFGTDNPEKSPLAGYGGDSGPGGLSGAPLLPIVVDWIKLAREKGFRKPIVACGGILRVQDVPWLKEAGASAIEIGSASILRPWRVQSIIDKANKVFA